MANPTGKGGFKKGQSGNPTGRAGKHIADLSREARKYAHLALSTLVEICKKGQERNRLTAALALHERGYGKAAVAINLLQSGKKLNEMSPSELDNFEALLVSSAQEDEPQSDMFH